MIQFVALEKSNTIIKMSQIVIIKFSNLFEVSNIKIELLRNQMKNKTFYDRQKSCAFNNIEFIMKSLTIGQ